MPLIDTALERVLSAWKRIKTPNLQHRPIVLKGAWRPSDDPVEIGENFVSMQNLYYGDNHPVPVTGHTKISLSVPNLSGGTVPAPVIESAVQICNDRFDTKTILVQAMSEGSYDSEILKFTADIPDQGYFSADELYQTTSAKGRFALAPNNSVFFCDGEKNLIWGGNESPAVGIINKSDDETIDYNFTDVLTNSSQDVTNVAVLRSTGTGALRTAILYVISSRPINGIKPYVKVSNSRYAPLLESVVTGQYWGASGWVTVGTIVDMTAADEGLGSNTLMIAGEITFTSTVGLAKQTMFNGVKAYHYKFTFTNLSATTSLYQLTVLSPMQEITDIWDGEGIQLQKVWKYDSSADDYKDYTVNAAVQDYQPFPVMVGDTVTQIAYRITYVQIKNMKKEDALIVGCQKRLSGVIVYMADKVNTASSGPLTAKYWDGEGWTTLTNIQDGTLREDTVKTFCQTGNITWDSPDPSLEFKTRMKDEPYLYYYKIQITATDIDNNCQIDCLMGIPAEQTILPYKFPVGSFDTIYLCNNMTDRQNAVRPTAMNTSTVWKEEILVGSERALTAGCCLPSALQTKITLMFKVGEVWALFGTYPNITQAQLSSTDGCPAPKTVKVTTLPAEIASKAQLSPGVAIWQGAEGVYVSDGRVPACISYAIRKYFDATDPACISQAMLGESIGWVDNENGRYHLRIASGSSETILNTELVFDFRKMEWSQVERQAGNIITYAIEVEDNYGNLYQYGFLSTGYMVRMDNGQTFDGTAIEVKLRLGDLALEGNDPYWETTLESIEVLMVAKDTTVNKLQVKHYLDTADTPEILSSLPCGSVDKRLTLVHRNVNKSGTYHGIEMSLITDDEDEGLEPLGINLHYMKVK
jgi:hypothetical protein